MISTSDYADFGKEVNTILLYVTKKEDKHFYLWSNGITQTTRSGYVTFKVRVCFAVMTECFAPSYSEDHEFVIREHLAKQFEYFLERMFPPISDDEDE